VNDLKTIADEYKEDKAENKHFFNVLSIDFLSKSVFAYTPNGKVIEIPR
jgi:(p)ppGpp synthase/HD superfamily hydrolase